MPGYTSDLYNYIVGVDPTFKNDVSLEQFKSKMSDTGYSKNMYNWVGESDKTFHSDVSFDAFREKLGYKKKVPTVLPSVQKVQPISSGTQPKETQKPLGTSVSQKESKPEILFPAQKEKRNDVFTAEDGKTYRLDMSTGRPVWKGYTSSVVKGQGGSKQDYEIYNTIISNPNTVNTLNKTFGKQASTSDTDQIYTGIVGKEENQYRVYNNNWQRLTPNSNNWEEVNSEGAISYLNKNYGKNVKVPTTVKKEDKGYQFTDINSQLTSKTEEKVVPYLQRQYGKLGFTFEESGLGTDYVKVTSKNGNTIEVGLDENNPEEALKLKSFLQGNKSAIQTEESKKINDFIREANRFDLGSEYKKQATKELKDYRQSQEFVDDLKQMNFNEIESNINSIKNKLIIINDKEGLQDFYNSSAYKLYKEKQKEDSSAKAEKIDSLYYELKQAKTPEEKKQAKIKIDTYLSNKVINKQSDNYNIQLGDVSESYKKLNSAISQFDKDKADLDQRVNSGNISQEEYESLAESINKRAEYLDSRRQEIKSERDGLISDMNKLQSITGQYLIDKEKTGSFAGNMLNSFISGTSKIFEPSMQVLASVASNKIMMKLDPDELKMLKAKGYNDEEIKNYTVNKETKKLKEEFRSGLVEAFGTSETTKEYAQSKDRGFFEKALSGVAESLPGMLAPGGAIVRVGSLGSLAYSSIEDEMLADKDFETTSALDRSVVALPYAIGMGILENLGVSAAMSKNPLAKSLLTKSLLSAVKKVGGDASKEVIENVINKEIKSNIAKYGIRIVGGALAEAETGALQSAVLDIGLKKLYNSWKDANDGKTAEKLTEGEYFSTPDTFMGGLSQVAEDAAAEAIGGWAMTTVGTSAQAIMNKGQISLYNDKDVEFLKGLSTDPEVKKMFIAKLKTNMLQGSMTKSEAQEQLNSLNNLESTFSKIPDNITGENLKKSVGLISERNKLTQEIEGKDESLTAVQQARISEINNELKTISENAAKESNIEEVTAEGGGVQYQGTQEGQPEVGQGEGAVGQATQPETDLGNRPVEGRRTEEARVEENKPTAVKESVVNVEETAKALDGVKFNANFNLPLEQTQNETQVAEAYIKAKQDGSNPELVKAVEDIIGKPAVVAEEVSSVGADGEIKSNWNYEGEGDAFASNKESRDGKSAYTIRILDRNGRGNSYNLAKQRGELDVKSPLTYEGDKENVSAIDGNGNTVGVIVLGTGGGVEHIVVAPEFSRKGVARELIKQIEQNGAKVRPEKSKLISPDAAKLFNKLQSLKETSKAEKAPAQEVATLRAEEQAELAEVIPNIEDYKVDGEVDKTLMTPEDLVKYNEVYDKYDKLITPLLPTTKEGPTIEQEVEAIGQLLSGTDAQIDQKVSKIVNKKIAKAVSRAAKAVSKIIPGTKFIVHDTDESYRAATKEEGLKQSSNGEFNPKTNTIHINGTSANARTVAHEVFHAILINNVKTNKNAAAVTKKMVEAISSKIDNNPELKKKLDNFLSNYEENIQNEEKLAELVGMLAENYNSMSASVKDIIARWIDKLANIFGLDPFNRNDTYEMLNTIARKVAKGEVISEADVKIIEDIDNGESFESQYVSTNGTVVITPSNRKSKVVGTVVSESDLVDPKTLVGKPLEVFYYDNFTSSPYELKNRISGSTIKRVGEGGPGYSYRPEIKKAGIIAAFTNVTKVLNSIQGIRSRNDVAKDSAVVGVALQNKETGHLGNKTTERDFYSPSEGVIAQAINDKLITENEAVVMLKGAVDAYASTSKGSDPKSSLGFTSNDFSTLDDFYKKIGAVSFERRGTFNSITIPSKEDLKITKATKPYVVTWLNSGIPTLKEYFNATTEQYTKEAEAHDIVKYLDPALDKIGVDGSVTISEAEKNRAKSMGVEIETISNDLIHTSYPVVLFGKNIGVPTTFHSVRDMSKDWDVPNPFFKAGRRSNKATPIIIPEIAPNKKIPTTATSQSLAVENMVRKQLPVAGNKLFNAPLPQATVIANRYAKSIGIELEDVNVVNSLNEYKSKAISNEFDKMKNDPTNPNVSAAYKKMAEETIAQYKEMIKDGYFIEINNEEPYSSSEDMISDLNKNKRFKVYSTESGFGDTPITEEQRRTNPLLKDSGFKDVNGIPLLVNDIFRFVHDFFGHAKIGNSFGPIGEENAWKIHSVMYSPLARRAMTSETRGQNSFVNFSGINEAAFKLRDKARELRKNGEIDKANELVGEVYDMMKFADQKIGLMPDWVSEIDPENKEQLDLEAKAIEDVISPRKQKPNTINDIVKLTKDQGFSDAAIRQYLKNQGYSDKESTAAINEYNVKKEGIFVAKDGGVPTKISNSIKSFKKKFFSARAFLPKSVFGYKENKEADIARNLNIVDLNVKDFNRLYKKYKGTKAEKDKLVEDFDRYIRGEKYEKTDDETKSDKKIKLPKEFLSVADSMRNQIDNLSRQLIDNGLVDADMAQTIKDNMGQYLTRSYKIYDRANWKKEVEEEVKQKARNFLRSQYRSMAEKLAAKEGIPVDEVLDNIVDNKMDEMLTTEGASNFITGSKLGAKDLSVLKERQDIPFEIRALMGVYSDPALNYAKTVLKLSSLAANHKFLTEVKNAGMGVYLFEKNDPRRPKDFNTMIAAEGSKGMNPLNGLYTTKEIASQFEAQSNQLGEFMKLFMKFQSSIRWAKTIGSVATHMKNIIGNLGFVWTNGHFEPAAIAKAYSTVKNDFSKNNKQDLRDRMNNYISLGIVKQSAGLGEIKDMFKDANWDTAMASRLSNERLGILGKAKRFFLQKKKGLEDAYQAEDDFFKIIAYENELSRYSEAMFNKNKNNLTEEELKEVNKVVTEIVKNTYPTYDRIPEAIKMIRRAPFIGNFVSFQAEAYRTAWNTMILAKNELASDNPKIKSIGAKRLTGATTYISAKTAILQYFSMAAGAGLTGILGYLFDDDDEEQRDKDIREFVAPWSKESDLIVVEVGNGKLKYIDFSASDPHGGIKKVMNSFLQGESTIDSFIDGAFAAVSPFIGEEMATESLLELKNNQDKYGKQIWNPEEDLSEQSKNILGHLYKLIEPGTFSSIRRGVSAENKGQEIVANITGFRVYDVDVNEQFGFKMRDYSERIKNAKKIYNSSFYNEEATADEKEKAYKNANKAVKVIYEDIIKIYNSAERLGVKPESLYSTMSDFGGVAKYKIEEIQSGKIEDLKRKEEE